jgi:hypothetical protein
MKSHQLQNSDSGNVEWVTPLDIIIAAKKTMGGIDLDPFSSVSANKRVGATHFFSAAQDGLIQDWFGRVWMNHPYGKATNRHCVQKLLMEFFSGNVEEACCITFANTSERWFRPLLDFPQCFLSPRTQYIDARTGQPVGGVTKGSVVTYLGNDIQSFCEAFKKLGAVKL